MITLLAQLMATDSQTAEEIQAQMDERDELYLKKVELRWRKEGWLKDNERLHYCARPGMHIMGADCLKPV